MDRIQRLVQGMQGGGQGGPPGDTPQVDTAEQIYISSLALLKMLKHGAEVGSCPRAEHVHAPPTQRQLQRARSQRVHTCAAPRRAAPLSQQLVLSMCVRPRRSTGRARQGTCSWPAPPPCPQAARACPWRSWG